jgi:transposase-like protein
MKRKRHTEEQILAILKEHEAGMKTADLCRKHGISEASFYNWKAKYFEGPRPGSYRGHDQYLKILGVNDYAKEITRASKWIIKEVFFA